MECIYWSMHQIKTVFRCYGAGACTTNEFYNSRSTFHKNFNSIFVKTLFWKHGIHWALSIQVPKISFFHTKTVPNASNYSPLLNPEIISFQNRPKMLPHIRGHLVDAYFAIFSQIPRPEIAESWKFLFRLQIYLQTFNSGIYQNRSREEIFSWPLQK